jgi:hypothetical protein
VTGQCFANFDGSEKVSNPQNMLTVNDYFHENTKSGFLKSFRDIFHSCFILNILNIPDRLFASSYFGSEFLWLTHHVTSA